MLVFPKMNPTNSHGFLFGRSDPMGPPAFKIEARQQKPQEEEIPIRAMAALKISRKHHPWWHQPYDLSMRGQIKTLTNRAESLVSQQEMPRSPEYILLAYCLLACASPIRALTNHTYWAYISNTPLLQVVEWMERGPIVSTNDSIHMPSPWSIKGPLHPEEEGKLINISLGYEVLPLCMGPAELCINVSRQTWAFALPPKKDFRKLIGLFTVLSLSVNHVYVVEPEVR